MNKGALSIPDVVGKSTSCCRRCYRDFTLSHAGERHFLTFTKSKKCRLQLYPEEQPRRDAALPVVELTNAAFP